MTSPANILCIGSVLWDVIGRCANPMRLGSDMPGRIERIPGGVAMNIAMTLARFGMSPALLTAVGRDDAGDQLLVQAARLGLICDHVYRSDDLPTDVYMAIEGGNGLIAAIADAHSLEAAGARILTPLSDGRLGSEQAPWSGPVALDGNLTTDLLRDIAASPLFAKADLRVAPASPGKAERLLALLGHPSATFYVNLEEAGLLCLSEFASSHDAARALIVKGAHRVLVTDGAKSATLGAGEEFTTKTPPSVLATRITGAGDTFMAAHIASELQGLSPDAALERALQAAATYVSGENPA